MDGYFVCDKCNHHHEWDGSVESIPHVATCTECNELLRPQQDYDKYVKTLTAELVDDPALD